MFFAALCDVHAQQQLPKPLQRALDYLRNTDFSGMEPGQYPIDGELIFANLMTSDTEELSRKQPEVHRRYLDVQYLIEGEELIGFALPSDEHQVAKPYDAEKDFMLYDAPRLQCELKLQAGMYAVFYPEELHTPGCCIGKIQTIRKVVVKIDRCLLINE